MLTPFCEFLLYLIIILYSYILITVLHQIPNNLYDKKILQEYYEQCNRKHVQLKIPHNYHEYLNKKKLTLIQNVNEAT